MKKTKKLIPAKAKRRLSSKGLSYSNTVLRSHLHDCLTGIIEKRGLSNKQITEHLNVSSTIASAILSKKDGAIGIPKLLDFLSSLDVKISINLKSKDKRNGKIASPINFEWTSGDED